VAQSGFTPIQLFRSATAAAVPTGASLVAGELAINTADERLFFTNSGGTVQLLASSAAAAGSFVTVAATTSVTTPLVTNAGTLALTATGANIVSVATNGAERMRITSGGNVGIGTTAPTASLDVNGNIRAVNGGGLFTSGGSTISGTAIIAVGGFFDLAVSLAGFVGMVSVSSVRLNFLPQNSRQIFYIANRNGVGSVSAALFTQDGSGGAATFNVSVSGGSIRVTDTSSSTGLMEINIAFSGAYSSGT